MVLVHSFSSDHLSLNIAKSFCPVKYCFKRTKLKQKDAQFLKYLETLTGIPPEFLTTSSYDGGIEGNRLARSSENSVTTKVRSCGSGSDRFSADWPRGIRSPRSSSGSVGFFTIPMNLEPTKRMLRASKCSTHRQDCFSINNRLSFLQKNWKQSNLLAHP